MSVKVGRRYEFVEEKIENGRFTQIKLFLADNPGNIPEREFTFTVLVDEKMTNLLSFSRWKSFTSKNDKFVKFYVYAMDIGIDKFQMSARIYDYSMSEKDWFDMPIEKIADMVMKEGVERIMSRIFEDSVAFFLPKVFPELNKFMF
jgi:hypothetical protein